MQYRPQMRQIWLIDTDFYQRIKRDWTGIRLRDFKVLCTGDCVPWLVLLGKNKRVCFVPKRTNLQISNLPYNLWFVLIDFRFLLSPFSFLLSVSHDSAFSVARSERLIQRQRSLHWCSASFACSAWGNKGKNYFFHAKTAESAEFLLHLYLTLALEGRKLRYDERAQRGNGERMKFSDLIRLRRLESAHARQSK